MKVVIFHPTLLPPKDYGGVERVVMWLAQGLLERDHEVYVCALTGSRLPKGAQLIEMSSKDRSAEMLLEKMPAGIDVVHFMAPPEAGVMERLPCGSLITVHGNGKPGEVFPLNTVFLSRNHAERHRASVFVHNGIDPGELQYREKKTDRFLFLSKTSWSVKNLEGAIRVCRRASVALDIAGGRRPWGLRARSLISPGLAWKGPVSGTKKAELLANAAALVFPVRWPEPFGLVVAEALMSGTPVIASRKGSLEELVPPEVGALLPVPGSPEIDAMWAGVLSDLPPWSPERCRAWAMEKFHYTRMAEGYETVYRKVAQGEKLHAAPPIAGDWRTE